MPYGLRFNSITTFTRCSLLVPGGLARILSALPNVTTCTLHLDFERYNEFDHPNMPTCLPALSSLVIKNCYQSVDLQRSFHVGEMPELRVCKLLDVYLVSDIPDTLATETLKRLHQLEIELGTTWAHFCPCLTGLMQVQRLTLDCSRYLAGITHVQEGRFRVMLPDTEVVVKRHPDG